MSDQSPSAKGRDSRLAIEGWPLRRKVALALAVPLLLAAVFGGLRVTNDLEKSANASASSKQVTILEPAIKYLTAAEEGMVAAQSSTGTSQNDLDDALVEIKAAGEELEDTRSEAELTPAQSEQVDVILDLSRALREGSSDRVSASTWIAQLRQMQSGVTELITTIINEQITPEPRLEQLSQALGGRFALAMQQALTANEAQARSRSGDLALYSELGAESAALDRLAGQVGEKGNESVAELRSSNGQRSDALSTGETIDASTDDFDPYDRLQGLLIQGVDEQLSETASDARNSALLNALLTLLALAAAIALAIAVSRTLVGPIRRVREGALRVANADLPAAVARIRSGARPAPIRRIDVTTGEEVGQLARAVDDLHQQAVTLASGEAELRTQVGEMFVTLSRRNTTLINQQLNLIEALERDEEDPKRLENLFRLDHLASRMRRTADSLLILADAPSRAAGWEQVSVGETLQAATAGVTEYQRVRVESQMGVQVDESAAGDLVHLVTELVDNSLAYSSPHTQVVLGASEGGAGVTITVSDSGLGIPPAELEVINENLRSGVEVTPDTARRMGLFVVSRLAQRHGIEVNLKANRGDGMTAYVLVPNAILPERAHLAPVVDAEAEGAESTFGAEPVQAAPVVLAPEPAEVEPEVAFEPEPEVAFEPEPEVAYEPEPEPELEPEPEPEPAPEEPAARADDSAVDKSDPLGLGDQGSSSPGGLPTRQRGATLPSLSAAGVAIPKADGDEEEKPSVWGKRPTGGMSLRSKRDLTPVPDASTAAQGAVDEPAEPQDLEQAEEVPATFEPVLVEAPVEPEPEPEPEPVVALAAVQQDQAPAESTDDPDATTYGQIDVEDAASNISALMAKIRPQRGRLPIPEYDEVDHAEILNGAARDRGTAGDPLTDPMIESSPNGTPVAATVASSVEEPVPAYAATSSAPTATTEQPAPAVTSAGADDGLPRSSWLTTDDDARTWASTEVEAGWERTADVLEMRHEPTNDAGLPVRQPGARLVPGSVTKPIGAAGRDPEAIRARLSAHKAGVRRGRTTPVSDDQ